MQALIEHVDQRVKTFGAQYAPYGLFGMGNAMFFYWFWRYLFPTSYESGLLRAGCWGLCLLLVLHRQWPRCCQRLLPLYWYLTLLVTLPYFFSYMLVMNQGSIMWLIWMLPIAFFVFQLVDVTSALILLAVGIVLGGSTAAYHLLSDPMLAIVHPSQPFNLLGFVVNYGVAIFMAAIFSHNRQLIEAFQREKAQLNLIHQEKNDFLANMSHDLRTPLSGLISLAELEANQLPDKHRLKPSLQLIEQSARQLQKLFESIIETIKLRQPLENAPVSAFSLDGMLQDIHTLFCPELLRKQLTCVIRPHTLRCPATLMGSVSLIETVCIHLLSNAIEYTPAQGRIIIEYDYLPPLDSTHPQPLCQIKVIDSGVGIAVADQTKIFESFQRLVPAYKVNHATGVGLGLYNCKRIADVLHGELSVTSQGIGKGSTFCFTFPIRPDTETTPSADAMPSVHRALPDALPVDKPLPSARQDEPRLFDQRHTTSYFLIVEDVKMIREMTKKIFQKFSTDCHIDTAENMSMALARAQEKSYDLILMDIGLPDGDGIEASNKIHSRNNPQSKNHDTPIIAITAHIDSETEKSACQRAGILRVIEKPLTQKKAQALYQAYLQKIGMHLWKSS